MGRLEELQYDEMTAEQQRVVDEILAGPRGGQGAHASGERRVRGPFNAWLRSPEFARHAQKVGAVARFGTTLPPRLSELAIIIMARHMRANFEWYAHRPLAIEGGLAPGIADAIQRGERPDFEKEDEAIVYDFATMLCERHNVGDETYARALDAFGERGVVELVAILGYYSLVSMTLNVFRVPLPEGVAPPFPD